MKHLITSLILLLCGAVTMQTAAADVNQQEGKNLLKNSDFTFTKKGNLPYWSNWNKKNVTVSPISKEDSKGALVTINSSGKNLGLAAKLTLKPNTQYIARIYAKADLKPGTTATIGMLELRSDDPKAKLRYPAMVYDRKTSFDWQLFTVSFLTPAGGAVSATFFPAMVTGNAELQFRNAEIREKGKKKSNSLQ